MMPVSRRPVPAARRGRCRGPQAMPPPAPGALSYDGTDVLSRSAMTPAEGKIKTGLGWVLSVAKERWTRRLRDQDREFWDDEVKRTGRRARRLTRDSDPMNWSYLMSCR